MTVPLATLQRELDAELAHLGPQALPMPPAARLVPGLGGLSVVLQRAMLLPAEGPGLRLRATLSLREGSRELTAAHTQVLLRPRLEGAQLVLAVRPADLERLSIELAPAAHEQISDVLKKKLPAPLRRLIPRGRLLEVSQQLLAMLTADGYKLLRGTLFQRLGEVGRLKLKLPELPLERAIFTSYAKPLPHLRLAVFTSLPVRRGWRSPLPPHPSWVRFAVSGSALAEIGNDAMRRGLVPQRYDSRLRPQAAGDHLPAYDWRAADARPLKLIVTKTSSPCARVVLGAKARLRREGEQVLVGISDGRIERVQGAPLTRAVVWLRQLWKAPVEKTRRLALGLELRLGGRRLALEVQQAQGHSEGLVLGLAVATSRGRPNHAGP